MELWLPSSKEVNHTRFVFRSTALIFRSYLKLGLMP